MGSADRGLPDNGNARRHDCDDTLPELGAAGGLPFERVTRGVPAPEAREQYTAFPGARKAIRAYSHGVSRTGREEVLRRVSRVRAVPLGCRPTTRVESVTGRTAKPHGRRAVASAMPSHARSLAV
jgi:hypothetical protein